MPGHLVADLVHHCGDSARFGDYVHTLQMIDVANWWSERVACSTCPLTADRRPPLDLVAVLNGCQFALEGAFGVE